MQTVTQKATVKATTPKKRKRDEKILVVPRLNLFGPSSPQGMIQVEEKKIYGVIDTFKKFEWRSKVEQNPSLKQIIPYIIYKFEDKIFVMQRADQSSEQRLKSKYSIGIGGHVRKSDLSKKSIFNWARRELKEEVNFSGSFKTSFLGLLNDESDEVGQVHTGFVYLMEGDTDEISVKSELQSGQLVAMKDCRRLYKHMERWSQIAFKFIVENKI
ncbi:hypothetical protein ACFLY6_00955 [Candidatus Dependentiae bacterium]